LKAAQAINNILTNKEGYKMTAYEFYAICSEACIEPNIALENEGLRTLLQNDASAESVCEYINNNF
jgi:alpha-L-arabinofuranosidase